MATPDGNRCRGSLDYRAAGITGKLNMNFRSQGNRLRRWSEGADYTAMVPLRIVTARPTRTTRSPLTLTRTTPPRGEAW